MTTTTTNEEPEVFSPEETSAALALPRADVPAIWEEYRAHALKLKATAETLTVTDVSQVAEMKLARATRLTLRSLRIAVEARRKELKEEALRSSQRIDADARALRELIEPLEARLQAQEDFIAIKEAEEQAKRKIAREEAMRPFGIDVRFYNLGDMPEAAYIELLENSKTAHEAKIAAVKKAEEDRLAKEAADLAERERVRQENIRLQKEAQERDALLKSEREAAEKERVRLEAQKEKAAKEWEAKMAAEREAAEKIRVRFETEARAAAEKTRKEREAAEAKAAAELKAQKEKAAREWEEQQKKIAAQQEKEAAEKRATAKKEAEARAKLEAQALEERKARERAEAELRAKREAEEKAARERAEAVERAAAAPDKAKLADFAQRLGDISLPSLTSNRYGKFMEGVRLEIMQIVTKVEREAQKP